MNAIQDIPRVTTATMFGHDSSTEMCLTTRRDGQITTQQEPCVTRPQRFATYSDQHLRSMRNRRNPWGDECPTQGYLVLDQTAPMQEGSSTPTSSNRDEEGISLPIPKKDMVDRPVYDILNQLYRLDRDGLLQAATDLLYDRVDRLLSSGAFDVCDELLKRAQVDSLSTSLMRSFLAITLPAKDLLTARSELFSRIKSRMDKERGQEVSKRLLNRLA